MASVYSFKYLKTPVIYVLSVLVFASLCFAETSRKRSCHDAEGNAIPDGSNFIPDKKDPCQTCQCEDGYSIMCTAVSCSPPDCIFKAIEGKCCEFVCEGPQPSYPQTPGVNGTGRTKPIDRNGSGITNLGLRLVASTITSFLVLALLLFMIHKLRQRRLFMSVRRLNSSRRRLDEVDHERYINDLSPPLGLIVPPYQDPPPPYSPPKPLSNIAPGEPPPPYEAINNNNTAPAQNNSDLPPAYQHAASSLPYNGAGNSRMHTTSESSVNSESEWLGPQFSPTINSTRIVNNRNQSDQRNRSVNVNSSEEDTRVKELFEQSWRSAQRSQASIACTSTNSVKSQQTSAVNTTDSVNQSQGSQQLPTPNSRSQNVINIFGPRCIKKSGSVEILRQSISPRNSYCLEGVSAAEVMSQSLDPSVLNRMLNRAGVGSPDTTTHLNGSESTSRLQNCNSETDTSLTSDPSNASSSGMSSLIRQMDASDRRRQFRLSNLLHSPIESTESPTSPLSPVGGHLGSNSIHSDLSWFSVCSETGEPRLRKSVITSDSKYPEFRHGGAPAPSTEPLSKFVPKIASPTGDSLTTKEDNSVEPKTELNFPHLCLTRNYSTERFDGLNNLRNGSVVHRSLSDIDLNKNRCRHENQEPGECTCNSCDKGTHSSQVEPWVMNTTNQNALCASKNQSYCSVDDIKSGKRKDRDAGKRQSFKSLKKQEKALSADSANANESLFRNINKFSSLGKNYLNPKKDIKAVKSTNNRDGDNSTLCAKSLTKSPKKQTKAENVMADLKNNKRNRKSSETEKKVHKPKTMLTSDV